MTSKGLRYIQMQENAVREQVQAKFIDVNYIKGCLNPSDIFTKEDRDVSHFTACTDVLLSDPPSSYKSHNHGLIKNKQGSDSDKQTFHSLSRGKAAKGGVEGLPVCPLPMTVPGHAHSFYSKNSPTHAL